MMRRWNVANLDDYWVPWLEDWRGVEPAERAVRHKSGLQWLVLGVRDCITPSRHSA